LAGVIFFRKKFGAKFIFLLLLFLFLGLWRYSVSLPVQNPERISYYNGEKITFLSKVSDEAVKGTEKQKIEVESFYLISKNKEVRGKVLLFISLYPEYSYGDKLKITCKPQKPRPFGGFAYDRFLAKSDIYSLCYYPRISRLGREDMEGFFESEVSDPFFSFIYSFKDELRQNLERGLPEPQSSLARAMILGDKGGITEELRQNFARAGLSHLMAISGMHIGILIAVFFWILLSLGLHRRQAFYIAGCLLLFYIILIGFPASAVRAGVMGFLLLLSFQLGRLNRVFNSLGLAACLMLLINPALLRDDIGFQLSFLAVTGIILFYPLFSFYISKFFKLGEGRITQGVAGIISLTLSAQILTLPLIAYNFSLISLSAIWSNLLVLPLLPFLLLALLAGLGLSLLLPVFSFYFFLPAFFLLSLVLETVRFFARIPWFFYQVADMHPAWLSFYYSGVLLFYFLAAKYKEIKEK